MDWFSWPADAPSKAPAPVAEQTEAVAAPLDKDGVHSTLPDKATAPQAGKQGFTIKRSVLHLNGIDCFHSNIFQSAECVQYWRSRRLRRLSLLLFRDAELSRTYRLDSVHKS